MSREGRRRWGLNQRFVIGKQDNPMMERWRLIQTPWFGLYVHFIHREDLDPVCHDHPWGFWRMVLRGGYLEERLKKPRIGPPRLHQIAPWAPSFFPVEQAHRIIRVKPGTVSLVLVGRKRRTWGFWREPPGLGFRQWVDYRDALGLRPTEGVVGDGVRDGG